MIDFTNMIILVLFKNISSQVCHYLCDTTHEDAATAVEVHITRIRDLKKENAGLSSQPGI